MMNRRAFLKAAITGAAAVTLGPWVKAAPAAPSSNFPVLGGDLSYINRIRSKTALGELREALDTYYIIHGKEPVSATVSWEFRHRLLGELITDQRYIHAQTYDAHFGPNAQAILVYGVPVFFDYKIPGNAPILLSSRIPTELWS